MSSANYHGPASTERSANTGVKEQAQQTAGTAADEGKHVAGVAKSEAGQVASEARQQARNLMNDARTQVEDQSRTQRDRLVNNLRTFTKDLEQMASNSSGGTANDLVRQVANTTRDLTDRLDGREPSELLDEVRRFARRRPGAFLLGAFAAGIVAGRVARGAKDARSDESTGAVGYDVGATSGAPLYPQRPVTDQAIGATTPVTRPTGAEPAPGTYTGTGSRWGDTPAAGAAPLTGDQQRRGTP